ncbi:MAG: hypothetical protein NXI28_23870 [bacterium]|nr:hypothetical protein [bacterium]
MKHMTKLREFESNPAFRGRLFIARFENLIDERATTEIRAILSHIGSTADATTVEHLLSQNNFQRKQRQQPQGNGFYRSGKQDSWSTELNQADVRSIEKAAGHLMAYYGYLPTRP